MARKTVQILDRQTIWDIAIQEYGSVDGVFKLMNDNPEKVPSLDANLIPGDFLKILSGPTDNVNLDYYRKNNLHPVTISSNADIAVGGDYNDDYNNDYFG